MRELPQISGSRRPRCALGILLLHFQMSLVLYTSLLHALDDSDVPHEVSEQYVLCYSRFSTPQPAEFDDAFTETARP